MSLLRPVLAAALPFAFATTAVAQMIPLAPMQAPVRVSPASGFFEYTYGTPNLSFVWDQRPFMAMPGQLPTHFLFCLNTVTGPNATCSHATAVFNLLPGTIPQTVLRNPITMQLIGIRYTYTPTIPDDRLDRIVGWQVMGCTGNADSSCKQSSHAWMVAWTMELRADSLRHFVIGDNLSITADGINTGSRSVSSHPSQVHNMVRLWEVLKVGTGTASTCRTDLNSPSDIRDLITANPTLAGYFMVINSKGRATTFSSLPKDANGNYIASDVIAIFRDGFGYLNQSTETVLALNPNQMTPVPGLPANPNQPISVPSNTRPRTFASAVLMDSRGVVQELDEDNNSRAKCVVVF